jgi:succinoglycan biosynthesis protein ExoM
MTKNKISVCIATYKRPDLLKKLLISIINQKNIDNFDIELIIVDNDIKRSSKHTVNKIKDFIQGSSRISLIYDTQPEKNISLTRNKTLELATGEFIFFIDDDEYADELCIYNHIQVFKNFDADVTFGNVLPYFDKNVPKFIKDSMPFYRINNISGEQTKYFITGNTFVKASSIKSLFAFFDPEYGLTGGSDNEFFHRLKNSGAKLLSSSDSIAYEFIPKERANIKWLIKRVFRTGNNYTRTLILSSDKKSFYLKITQLIKGILQAGVALLLALVFIWHPSKSFNWFLKSVSNISKPFAVFGYYPQEYKN